METPPADDGQDAARAHPWFVGPANQGTAGLVANIAVCASVPILAIATVMHKDVPSDQALGVVAIAAVAGIAMRYRARWPLPVLGVALLGAVAALLLGRASPALGLACEIAVFTVACLRPRRVSGTAALVSAVVLFVAARSGVSGPITAAATLIVVVWTALAFSGGVAVRTQRAYVTALAERARRADENYEQEARTRVAEERVRIARELHDVVAHHIAVISVHAGLARRAVGRDASTVDSSLSHVQEAARTVLDELGTVLNVLRSSEVGESGTDPTTQPAPGLGLLDELLATFAAAGLEVRMTTSGPSYEMDQGCDLAAFRIIQESLTNASKHGADGQAGLALTSEAGGLTIEVSNLARLDQFGSVNGTLVPVGHGLMGMYERAASCGGTFTARQDDHGVFTVVAAIPRRPTRGPGASPTSEDVPGRHRGPAYRVGAA
jgi:signal transduction histidine kinase